MEKNAIDVPLSDGGVVVSRGISGSVWLRVIDATATVEVELSASQSNEVVDALDTMVSETKES